MWNHADIVLLMENPFDYDLYCQKVENPETPWMYGQRVGFLIMCIKKFPELSIGDAQKAMTQEMNNSPRELKKGNKSSCCSKSKDKQSVNEKPLGLIGTTKNLIKSTTEHMSKGMSHVSHEEHLRRLNICKDCKWVKDGFQCGQCHCFMGIKAGWDIKNACKLNKW